jgi:hypothetical protein
LESIISLVTTILLLALALLAKKYRLLLREVLRETKKGLLLRSSLRSNVLRSHFASFAACKVNVVHGYTRLILGSFRYVQAAVFYNLVDVTGGELTNKIIKIQ